MFEELPRRAPVSFVDQLGNGELARAVDADEQVQLAFGGLHLGNIDMEEADGAAPEELTSWLVTVDIRQTRDAVPLQTPV